MWRNYRFYWPEDCDLASNRGDAQMGSCQAMASICRCAQALWHTSHVMVTPVRPKLVRSYLHSKTQNSWIE